MERTQKVYEFRANKKFTGEIAFSHLPFRDKSDDKNYCFAHEEFLANSQTLMKFLRSHFHRVARDIGMTMVLVELS